MSFFVLIYLVSYLSVPFFTYGDNFPPRKIVEECRDSFLADVPESERPGLRWEHVGSTSIEGMPGTKMPDALLIVPEFPPSKGVIQAFLDCGYYFSSSSSLDVKDLWWFLVFHEGKTNHPLKM